MNRIIFPNQITSLTCLKLSPCSQDIDTPPRCVSIHHLQPLPPPPLFCSQHRHLCSLSRKAVPTMACPIMSRKRQCRPSAQSNPCPLHHLPLLSIGGHSPARPSALARSPAPGSRSVIRKEHRPPAMEFRLNWVVLFALLQGKSWGGEKRGLEGTSVCV